jgi:diguanylate cyclase (GGDEF)-like protein
MKRFTAQPWPRYLNWLAALWLALGCPVSAAPDPAQPVADASALAAASGASAKRRVLVIYSRHDQAPWQAGVLSGLRARLASAGEDMKPILFEERMDALRFTDPASQSAFLALLTQRYANVALDLVVAESQDAFEFLIRNPGLFPGAERYLVGNVGRSGQPQAGTVVSVEEDIPGATEAVLKVLPHTRKVVVVVDRTPYGQAIAAKLRRTGSALSVQTALEVWNDFSYDDLLTRASQLPEGSAILWFPVFEDNTGARRPPLDTLRQLLQRANAPVFSHHDVNLGLGVVGGYMVSAKSVGDLIGRLALGQPPTNGAALQSGIKAYYFDAQALQRWGIDAERLPPGSNIINQREPLPWLNLGWRMLAVAAAIVLQALLIVALVVNLRQRNAAVRALAREHALLEQRVAERTAELKHSNEQLAALSATDGLTGVANRRRFDQALASEWSRASRSGQPLALVMLDLDWFKKYNDRYGHQAGDECLRKVAQVMAAAARREGDLVARYGGEEFALISAATNASAAVIRAQSICEALENLALPHELSRFGVVTVSAGVASLVPGAGNSAERLVQLADQALYKAKSQGRNRVELALALADPRQPATAPSS